jgi:hypothetical protein
LEDLVELLVVPAELSFGLALEILKASLEHPDAPSLSRVAGS